MWVKASNWLLLFSFSLVSDSLWPHGAAFQASLSFTISQSLLKLMFIKSMMPSNHLLPCHPFSSYPQSFPESESFPMTWLFQSGGPSIGASVSASFLLVNIQGWFPLGLSGLISLLLVSKCNFGINTLQSVEFLWQFNSCYQWKYLLVRFLQNQVINCSILTWICP